ncbi:MAG TPA: ATP-binding protein, partial [Steroidobacteraceae bacterium]|nr:ATP-binding protein [Steroidobacteraceae bacterium]
MNVNLRHSLKSNAPCILSAVGGAYAFIGGLVSLIGWIADIARPKDWWNTGISIKANTAVATMALGATVLAVVFRPTWRRRINGLAAAVAILGAATLIEHLFEIDLGIDQLLFDELPGAAATASPGRMGPPAALSLLALGISILCLMRPRESRRFSVGLALAVFGIGTLSVTGYMYGAEAMYTIPRISGISLQTATMLVALSIGTIAAHSNSDPMKTLIENSSSGALARRVLFASFVIPLSLGWLRIFGQRINLYDFAFGTALRTVIEIAILLGFFWWSLKVIRDRESGHRKAEAEREKTEDRMRRVLESSSIPFTILEPVRDSSGSIVDFRWLYVNPATAASVRRPADQLEGKRLTDAIPKAWSEVGLFENYVAAAERNETREFELHSTVNRPDGWFHVVVSPLDGNIAVWFADTTDRKRQELELRNADRRKDEFLATLAHELRNPLAPIRQAAMLLKRSAATELQRQWCNDVIDRQVKHMSLLLDDLLDVSRITRGMLQLRLQPTELTVVVETAVEASRPHIDAKKHTLKIELPPQSTLISVDPLRMAQVISNLLNNAAKYTNSGGMLHLFGEVEGEDLVLQVTDNGIGIARDEIPGLFNMFSQVKSAQERSEGGLGIGLALTKGLVELHGGRIEVKSEGVGLGSTFKLRIPNVAISRTSETRTLVSLRPMFSRRILIADDNHDAAESLAMLLREDGHDVKVAHDGEQAL